MGRSVMVHSESIETIYLYLEIGDFYEFADFLDYLRDIISAKYSSYYRADSWSGHPECHIILENSNSFITVSEYCSTISICLVPRDDLEPGPANLARAWCYKIADNFRDLIYETYPENCIIRLGTFSNGESVYHFKNDLDRGTIVERGQII